MTTVCMIILTAIAVVYASVASHDRNYWKERCEQMQQGYYDRETIKIVNDHRQPKRYPGPTVRFFVGGAE